MTKTPEQTPAIPRDEEWVGPTQKSRFRVLRSEGDGEGVVEIEFCNEPNDPGPPLHWHPFADETFTVVSGCLELVVEGRVVRLEAGQSHVVPRRVPHRFTNGHPTQPVVFRSVHTPGRHFEQLLASIYDLDLDGRVDERGAPGLLAMMAILERHPDVTMLHGPPRIAQLALAKVLGPVARLLGHSGCYRARKRAAGPTALAALTACLLVTACGGASYEALKGATVSHELDANGDVSRVIAAMKMDELVAARDREASVTASVPWDDVVRETTFIHHLQIDYNAHGHGPPGRDDIAHVDIHFQAIGEDERAAIDCQGEPEIESDRLPEGYTPPGVLEPPFGSCIRGMGIHADDGYDALTANMIMGYHAGALTFIEPMIDVEKLLAKETIELAIPRPARVGRATRYPSTFSASHDEATDSYVFVARDFIEVAE